MTSRVLWATYALLVAAFLGRSGQLPATIWGWLWLLVFAVWLLSAAGAVMRMPWSCMISLLCFVPFAVVLAFHTVGRVLFVLRYGGFDCGACQGSPLLFLWNWLIELALLVPGLALSGWLWRSSRNSGAC